MLLISLHVLCVNEQRSLVYHTNMRDARSIFSSAVSIYEAMSHITSFSVLSEKNYHEIHTETQRSSR